MSRPLTMPLTAALLAWATAAAANAADVGVVTTSPLAEAAASLLAKQIRTRSRGTTVVQGGAGDDFTATLAVDPTVGAEAFELRGSPANLTVVGGDARGVLFGVGRFLRASSFQRAPAGASAFVPGGWRGRDAPAVPNGFRGMYLATHDMNYYQASPVDEVGEYIAELASLWGANTIMLEMPWEQFSGFDDPGMVREINLTSALFQQARAAGIRLGLVGVANQGFTSRPDAIKACYPLPGNHFGEFNADYPQVSPSKPGGLEYLVKNYRELFSRYKSNGIELDVFVSWPYDEGGSACPGDWPWGSTGFLNVSHELVLVGKSVFPNMETILSTWGFDAPASFGEFDGLDAYLRANPGVFHSIMADGAPNGGKSLPPWPVDKGHGPGGLPLLNFPEISMWGRTPWGGFGANPTPARLDALWAPAKKLVSGGMPYSEGIFDDINQAICFQQYWSPDTTSAEVVADYVGFEFGRSLALVKTVVDAVALLEQDYQMSSSPGPCYHVKCGVAPNDVCAQALALVESAERLMTAEASSAWRWRIIRDRAVVDNALGQTGGQVTGPNATAAVDDLTRIYHADDAKSCLKPPSPSNRSCAPPAPGTCALDPSRGSFVPWVRVVNVSTVYGTRIAGGPTTPLLGLFDTEDGCRGACEAIANCTQYAWQLGEVCQEEGGQWRCDGSFAKHCYGKCDAVWTSRVVNGTVSARRVNPAQPWWASTTRRRHSAGGR